MPVTATQFQCLAAALAVAILSWLAIEPIFRAIAGSVRDKMRRFWSLSRLQKLLVAVIVLGFVQYGATKTNISFDGGIRQDSAHESIVSNNLVEIHWMRDTTGGVYVPTNATVYIDYRVASDTNAVWETLAETIVGRWQWAGILANATNYAYNVWAYYIPPEPVHTNGVWIYRTMKDRGDKNPLPLRARIEINGKAIATPAEKRKDERK